MKIKTDTKAQTRAETFVVKTVTGKTVKTFDSIGEAEEFINGGKLFRLYFRDKYGNESVVE